MKANLESRMRSALRGSPGEGEGAGCGLTASTGPGRRQSRVRQIPGAGQGRNRVRAVAALLLAWGLAAMEAVGADAPAGTNAPAVTLPRTNYSSFRIVTERNIFNANRSGRTSSRRSEGPRVRVDTVTLVGTLQGERGLLALFDGSSSENRKAVRPGDKVATFKVAAVAPTKVTLEDGTNRVDLLVGARLRKEEDQPWRVTGNEGPAVSAAASSESGASAGGDSGGTGGGEVSDVVKRLMQQREKELK